MYVSFLCGVYVCVYEYMCMYVHVCMYVCVYVCACVYVCEYTCKCVYIYMHVRMCVCIYVCMCVCMFVCVCVVCMCVKLSSPIADQIVTEESILMLPVLPRKSQLFISELSSFHTSKMY